MERYSDLQVLVAKKAGVGRGQLVLDAGTGPEALLTIRLAEFVGDDGLVITVDYERSYISAIKDAITKSGFSKRISFLLSDLRYVPIRDRTIDAALSLDTVQNMYGNGVAVEKVIKDYIGESMRIVKTGRKVVVGTRHPVPRNKAQEVYMIFVSLGQSLNTYYGESRRGITLNMSWSLGLRKLAYKTLKQKSSNITFPIQRMCVTELMVA